MSFVVIYSECYETWWQEFDTEEEVLKEMKDPMNETAITHIFRSEDVTEYFEEKLKNGSV